MSRYQIVSNNSEDLGKKTFFEIEADQVVEMNGIVYFRRIGAVVELVAQFHILHWMWMKI